MSDTSENDFVGCAGARSDDGRLDGVDTPYGGVNSVEATGETLTEVSETPEGEEDVDVMTDEDLLSHDGVKEFLKAEESHPSNEIPQSEGYVK